VLPLERQAGVGGMELRRRFPRLLIIGHVDKMTMTKGEAAELSGKGNASALQLKKGFFMNWATDCDISTPV